MSNIRRRSSKNENLIICSRLRVIIETLDEPYIKQHTTHVICITMYAYTVCICAYHISYI